VVADVEVGVVDPHRLAQLERHVHEALAHARLEVDAGGDDVAHGVEGVRHE
jgi:hypothetical protein